jgi:hypothetical protein
LQKGTGLQLAKKVFCDRRTIPQRLKPDVFSTACGTAGAVPFKTKMKKGLFQQAVLAMPYFGAVP